MERDEVSASKDRVTSRPQKTFEGPKLEREPFTKADISNDFYVKEKWLPRLGKSSRDLNVRRLLRFCNWCGMSPTELIERRKNEIDDWDPRKSHLESLRDDYIKYLEENGLAPNTIGTGHDVALRGFFTKVLGREYSLKVDNYEGVGIRAIRDREMTLSDITLMTKYCDLEGKLRIIWPLQNGQRPEDMVNTVYGGGPSNSSIKRAIEIAEEMDSDVIVWEYLPIKERRKVGWRKAWLGGDGLALLKAYIEKHSIKEGDYIFKSEQSKSGKKKARTINDTIVEAAKAAGFERCEGRVRYYCLRHYFHTSLTTLGHKVYADYIMGHILEGVTESYLTPTREHLVEVYENVKHALNPLSVGRTNGKLRHEISKQMQDLAMLIMQAMAKIDPKKFKEIADEILRMNFDIKYDEGAELKPAIYIFQDAIKAIERRK